MMMLRCCGLLVLSSARTLAEEATLQDGSDIPAVDVEHNNVIPGSVPVSQWRPLCPASTLCSTLPLLPL